MANLRVDKITSTETFETTGSVQFLDPQTTRTSVPDSATLQLGSDDFTMECWRLQHTDPGNAHVYASKYTSPVTNASFWFGSINAYRESFFWYDGTNEFSIISEQGVARIGQWDHIAASREGDTFRLFVNGKLVGSRIHAVTLHDDSNNLTIGSDSSTGKNELNGFLSNLRIIKGKAIYTANFKPPMRELEVTPETILLCCQSKTDASLEKTGKVITVGDAVANELTPGLLTPIVKSGGGSAITGSVEFDGTGDYLSIPDSTDFTFGTGDFTIEFWRYRSRVANTESYVTKYDNTNATQSFWFGALSSGREDFAWYSGSSGYSIISANNTAQVGEWGHLAAVRYNGDITLYLNGVAIGSDTSSDAAVSFNDDSNPLIIGGDNYSGSTYDYQGFISNLRIVKGTALYTADFIPPTRELKKVPGTVLLCCQDPDSPLTEATGKTITGYGDLHEATDVEMLTNGASNFTPQVGDDRKVTFEGVTKINSDAYFYLPTGDTESRDKGAGTRGISFGGSNPSRTNIISYINISTTGNAKDFGDLLDKMNQMASAASSTRGISAGGFGTSPTENEIDTVNYITIASTGDALDFGDLTLARRLLVGCSSQTRGIFAGGYDAPNKYNRMDYVTIASTGNALDFGDISADGQTPDGRYSSAGYASPTRGVWHGGYGNPAYRNIIDYVTIASTGNTKDFGDSSIANYYMGGCSNSIRGISAGAFNPGPAHQNLIEYTTIATTGNAKDFGDLPQKMMTTGACASQIRGVYLGGQIAGAYNNTMVYVTIMTMGNALDFGDLTTTMGFNAGCSNGHGGLG